MYHLSVVFMNYIIFLFNTNINITYNVIYSTSYKGRSILIKFVNFDLLNSSKKVLCFEGGNDLVKSVLLVDESI